MSYMPYSLDAMALRKSFDAREVVSGVDLHVRPGEVVGLLGASGSGKSTIFNLLTGLLRPDAGRILLDGHDISNAGIDVRARLGIGYVPQSPNLFGSLTAEQNLRIALESRDQSAAQMEQILSAVCRGFGIGPILGTRLGKLSGGERRRVEIAFAICGRPRFLLLDEPFVGLDPIVSTRLSLDIVALARAGIGILLTDHKVREALKIVERTYVIDNGVVIAAGDTSDVVQDDHVRAAFLGDQFSL